MDDLRGERKSSGGVRASIVGAAVALAVALCPGQAQGGTYPMRNCDVPGHPNAAAGPWRSAPSPTTAAFDGCLSGGGFGIRLPGVRQMYRGNTALYELEPPTTGPQSAIRLTKIELWFDARMAGSGSSMNAVRYTRNADGSVSGGIVYDSPNGDGYTQADMLQPERTVAYSFGIACYDGPSDCYPDDATPLRIRGAQVTLREDVAPSAGIVGGTLLDPGPQAGVRSLEYTASDLQSGLAKVEVLVDADVVATRDLTSRCAYADFAACPDADRASMSVDTRTVPNGWHGVMLRVSDAAGNQQSIRPAAALKIANGSSPAADATQADGTTASGSSPAGQLTARFKATRRANLTLRYGRRASIEGRLSAGSNGPLAGAVVDVFERQLRSGAPEVSLGSVQTGADGAFSYMLAPRGPSRSLRFVYAGDQAGSQVLKVRVRAAATLRASLRGVTIRYRGRVLSGPLPHAGKRVLLQGKAPGFAWSQFAVARTDAAGRFSGRYGLAVRRHGVRLQIRAIVPVEHDYPYARFRSAPVTLRVR